MTAVFLLLAVRFAIPTNLIWSDLGRHIKNGELISQGVKDVLYKNYYSYTCPDYHFVNHHWLFGVFCYFIWHQVSFTGLSIAFILLVLLTFYVFFSYLEYFSSFGFACAFGLLCMPLINTRPEIRPEEFSVLFCGLFLWLLTLYQEQRVKPLYLSIGLASVQIIWVNTHIFFIIGPAMIILYWLQARLNDDKNQARGLQKIFVLVTGACFINPSGWQGVSAPFHVSKASNFIIDENNSILSAGKYFFLNPYLSLFLVTMIMLFAAGVVLIQKQGLKKYFVPAIMAVFLCLISIKWRRFIGPYGYFWIPLCGYAWWQWMSAWPARARKMVEILLIMAGVVIAISTNFDLKQPRALGLVPGSNRAAEFFKQQNISGPIFNGYDIGGYLIFHLSPRYKLFVDNRMEAFPSDFFKNTYSPMMMSDEIWKRMDGQYHFNTIFNDFEGNAGTDFFLRRLKDPSWALVYFDGPTYIFLKRNKQNEAVIQHYEMHLKIKINPPAAF